MARWTCLLIAFLIAVWAQRVVSVNQHVVDGLILFGAAAALFIANAPAPREEGRASSDRRESLHTPSRRALSLAGLALGMIAASAVILWSRLSNPVGLALWLGGLLLFLVALWPAAPRSALPSEVPLRLEILILILILLSSFLARTSALGTIPNGLQSDEGNNGLEALKWLAGTPYSPYAEANEGQATLFTYLIALSFKLFGVSVPAMRLVPAVAGTLTVVLFYALARELFGSRAGLVGTAFLAASRWHLTFSRIIYELILLPLCAIGLFYFLYRGLRDGRRRDFILAGYALALGLNTYTAFRVIPLGVALLALYWLIERRQRFAVTLRRLGLFAFSGVVGLVPLAIYTLQRPEVVLIRTKHISIFQDVERAGSLSPLWGNVRKYLLMFNVRGDGGSLNNLPDAPMLDVVVGALFVLGLAYAFWHWRQPRMFLLLAWAVGVLPAGILSVAHEAPSARRVIGLIPGIYLLVAAVVDAFWRASLRAWRRRGHRAWAFGFGALVVVVGLSNLLTYFTVQARHPSVWRAYSPHEAAIGHYIASLEQPSLLYLSSVFNKHSAITFIARNPDYLPLDLSRHLPVREPRATEVIYILEPASRPLEPLFHQFYPEGVWKEHLDPYEGLLFNTFAVTPAQQVEAHGLNARYYRNAEWRSPAAFIRRDAAIAFDWREDSPLSYPFSVEWHSALLVPQYGQYGLTIQTSGPFSLTLGGEVTLSGEAGSHSTEQVLVGGFHDFRLRYVAETDAGGPILLWKGPVGEQQVVPPVAFYAFEVPPFGLTGYYYPNAKWQGSPRVVQHDIFITPGEGLRAPYSIAWRGKLLIEQAGLYKLGTNSDDGSLLFVDGRLVVDNGGLHGARYVEGSANLTAGYHDFELRYFQDGGSRALDVWWTLPGGKSELIPPTNLFPWEGDVPSWLPVKPKQVEASLPGGLADRTWQMWVATGEDMMSPRGVAVSPVSGRIYVADASGHRVRAFDAEGRELFAFGQDANLQEPGDLVVNSRGDVFVLDPPADSVLHFGGDGQFIGRLRDELRLFRPRGIGIDRSDRLYIADTGGSRVVVVSAAGEALAVWGGPGTEPGRFDQPTDVAVGPDGQVYVADAFNQRVQWLDADGAYLGEWSIVAANTYDSPHLAISPANVLYLTSPEEHQVLAYDLAGRFLGQLGGRGEGEGQFLRPVAIAVDALGRLYVTDPLQGRVQGFQPEE